MGTFPTIHFFLQNREENSKIAEKLRNPIKIVPNLLVFKNVNSEFTKIGGKSCILLISTRQEEGKMARKPRVLSSTGIYHVMLRGNNRQPIFEDEEDEHKFLQLLRRYQRVKTQ